MAISFINNFGALWRQKFLVALISFLALFCILSVHKNIITAQYINTLKPISLSFYEEVLCKYSKTDEALPPADSIDFSPSLKSIFFHETSCTGNLSSRQWCAIESAARAHPDFQINVLINAPLSKAALEDINLKHAFENVRLARIHIDKYAKGSAVEDIVVSGKLIRSRWRVSHTSDVLRFLTLSKWGGIYLDMDFVVAKRLDALGQNWAARESTLTVSSGALAFSGDEVGRGIARAAISDLQTNFKGDHWSNNGPGVITRVLKKICATTNITAMNSASCKGIEVHGPELFYPITWQKGKEYFKPGKLKNKNAYAYHVWNQITKGLKVDKASPYVQLARQYCPATYKLYGDQFGS